VPLTCVFTKIDKKKGGEPPPAANIAAFKAELRAALPAAPPFLCTSAVDGRGRDDVLRLLAALTAAHSELRAAQLLGGA
jgi:hypothetical protein